MQDGDDESEGSDSKSKTSENDGERNQKSDGSGLSGRSLVTDAFTRCYRFVRSCVGISDPASTACKSTKRARPQWKRSWRARLSR